LAFPEEINRFFWEGTLLGQEFENAAASLNNLEVSILSEDYLQ
jgi:hypothetical protein